MHAVPGATSPKQVHQLSRSRQAATPTRRSVPITGHCPAMGSPVMAPRSSLVDAQAQEEAQTDVVAVHPTLELAPPPEATGTTEQQPSTEPSSGGHTEGADNEVEPWDIRAAGVVFYCLHPKSKQLHVFLVKQQKDKYNLPGGKRNSKSEGPEDIAAREVEEETHWLVPAQDLLPVLKESRQYWVPESKYVLYMVHLPGHFDLPSRLRQQITEGKVHPEAEQITDAKWFNFDNFVQHKYDSKGYVFHQVPSSILRKYKKNLRNKADELEKGGGQHLPTLKLHKPERIKGRGKHKRGNGERDGSRRSSSGDESGSVSDAAAELGGLSLQETVGASDGVQAGVRAGVQAGTAGVPEQQLQGTQVQVVGTISGPMLWPDGTPLSSDTPPALTVVELDVAPPRSTSAHHNTHSASSGEVVSSTEQ